MLRDSLVGQPKDQNLILLINPSLGQRLTSEFLCMMNRQKESGYLCS